MGIIFVSYARHDMRKVNNILQELQPYGFDFWQDVHGIRNGKDWPEEITKAILKCSRFLLCMSESSMASDNVRREVQIAYEQKKTIVILRLDESNLPPKMSYQLIGKQRTDYQTNGWEANLVLALGGKIKPRKKTNVTAAPRTPRISLPQKRDTKQTIPENVISELESTFSSNEEYYRDECEGALIALENLRTTLGAHWLGKNPAYKTVVPQVYVVDKVDLIRDMISEFQMTCPPGDREKRLQIVNELRQLSNELSKR
ncbi:MAG: toll/interleukin-1 receptor domain-containing protein [Chloroflexi bacterium]|nr:toll/interleukin-1 receptor domain-containing protein [Chloroflexota bacterium]